MEEAKDDDVDVPDLEAEEEASEAEDEAEDGEGKDEGGKGGRKGALRERGKDDPSETEKYRPPGGPG